ncbi:MAG TPA: hypothetical protein PLO05_02975 [Bacteroidales bacterium]|nr:hypothetical protein [Bacteroidales bacterium]
MFKKSVIIIFLILLSKNLLCQLNDILDISFENIPIESCLIKIENKTGYVFAYNPEKIPEDSIVNRVFNNSSLQNILESILPMNYEFLTQGKHIIIRPIHNKTDKINNQFIYHGKVYNALNSLPIKNVKIIVDNSSIVKTDHNGYFRTYSLNPEIQIYIEADSFKDTAINISHFQNEAYIYLPPQDDELNTILKLPMLRTRSNQSDSLSPNIFVKRFVPRSQLNNSKNSLEGNRIFQFSLLPGIGSSGLNSNKYKFNNSINILGGYTGGINGYEIGLGFNIVKHNVLGFQYGNLFNYVGGSILGTQFAIGLNIVNENVFGFQTSIISNYTQHLYGIQFSAISNITTGTSKGVQIAGISNISTDSLNGYQVSLITNSSYGKCVNSQIAGLINYSHHTTKNIQFATIANFSQDIKGVQFAGIINQNKIGEPAFQFASLLNKTYINKGLQLSAITNISKINKGFQLSLINISDTVKGFQFGLINYSKHNAGAAVGLFTIIEDGYRALDISYASTVPLNISFKSGVKKLYNIIELGFLYKNSKPGIALGYGLGSGFGINKYLFFNTDITVNQIFEQNQFVNKLNLLVKLDTEIGVNIAKTCILFVGPSLNYLITKWQNPYTDEFLSDFTTNTKTTVFNEHNTNLYHHIWLGLNIGIRL